MPEGSVGPCCPASPVGSLSEDAPLCVAIVAFAPSTLAVAFTPAPEVEFDTRPLLAVAFALAEALALDCSAAELSDAPSEALAP